MKMNDVVSSLKSMKNDLGDIVPPEVVDRVLESMGLQVRRSSFIGFASGTGIFLAGVVIGGAAALLLAPKAGMELRGDLEDKLDGIMEKLKGMVGSSKEEGASASGGQSDKGKNAGSTTGGARPGGPIHHS